MKWVGNAEGGLCSLQVVRWFYPHYGSYANVYVGGEKRHAAPLSLSISATDTVRSCALAANSLEGSDSDSKGCSIVSRMRGRWLTGSVFLHLAFDLRHALMLVLM